MMDYSNAGFATKAIHGGNIPDKQHGALTMPVYLTSTFAFDNCEQGGKRFAGEELGYIYTRPTNPSATALENKIAMMEGAEAAVAFGSGMGAITAVLWSLCRKGIHVVADTTLYGCSFAFLSHGMTRYGVEVTFVDLSDPSALQGALRENTAVVYFETPCNPTMKIIDIKAVADTTHAFNPAIKVVCDNTFATPYLQQPLKLGCDVVVHSATKYLNGHGDVVAGIACGRADFMNEVRIFGLKEMNGASMSPFDAFLVLRGLKTLEIRMERHCANAIKVVEYLKTQTKVEKIYFPGLPDHPGHNVAKKQMMAFGAMISFEVKGGKSAAMKLLDNMKLCTLAVSLGDAETLVEHPASMTHSTYTPAELKEAGIPEGLVRLSVGLETYDDIASDLEQVFKKI